MYEGLRVSAYHWVAPSLTKNVRKMFASSKGLLERETVALKHASDGPYFDPGVVNSHPHIRLSMHLQVPHIS